MFLLTFFALALSVKTILFLVAMVTLDGVLTHYGTERFSTRIVRCGQKSSRQTKPPFLLRVIGQTPVVRDLRVLNVSTIGEQSPQQATVCRRTRSTYQMKQIWCESFWKMFTNIYGVVRALHKSGTMQTSLKMWENYSWHPVVHQTKNRAQNQKKPLCCSDFNLFNGTKLPMRLVGTRKQKWLREKSAWVQSVSVNMLFDYVRYNPWPLLSPRNIGAPFVCAQLSKNIGSLPCYSLCQCYFVLWTSPLYKMYVMKDKIPEQRTARQRISFVFELGFRWIEFR